MSLHSARIERSHRKDLEGVEVQLTMGEPAAGRPQWKGEFLSRSADGIVPDERLALTLDTGEKGTARVSETQCSSRTPETTLVLFTGISPLE
jgi:hypothetical protein